MAKFLTLSVVLFYTSVCGAVDLSKLDGQAPGAGCENVAQYFYSVAKFERDIGSSARLPKSRLVDDFKYDVASKLLNAFGRAYFDELHDFLSSNVDEIWRLTGITAEEFREITRLNCETMKGETTEFISFETTYMFRQQSKVLTQP